MPELDAIDRITGVTAEETIDWATMSIPEEVIKATPAFKELLSESIQRRQKIAELQAAAAAAAPVVDETPAQVPVDATLAAIQQLTQTVTALQDRLAQTETVTREQRRANILSQHGIPDDLRSLVTGDDDETFTANALLVKARLMPNTPADKVPAGTEVSVSAASDLALQARNRLKGTQGEGIFSPGVQRQAGGGPVTRS